MYRRYAARPARGIPENSGYRPRRPLHTLMAMDTTAPGALHPPFSPAGEHLEDPYPYYAWARDARPVFFSPDLQMWCVTRYEDVSAILGDPKTYSSTGTIPELGEPIPEVQAALADYRRPRNLLNMDPPEHTALRGMVRLVFSPRRVAAMEPTVREVTAAVVDAFAADGHADLVARFAYPLPLTVILRLLGIPAEDMDLVRRLTNDLKLLHLARRLPAERQVQLARNVVAHQAYMEDLTLSRQASPGEDLVSYLIAAGAEDGDTPLSLSQVADLAQGLVIGGHETSANAIGNVLHQVLAVPARWDAVCGDAGLIDAAVEEGLRVDSAVSGMIRTTTRPVTVGGVELPTGTRLFLLFGSANTDERAFPDAGHFRLDRSGQPVHLSFGRGIHYCVGAPLARLEARVALEELTRRLPTLRLDPDAQLRHVPTPLFRGFTSLPVRWEP
jgi:cytochrome P450